MTRRKPKTNQKKKTTDPKVVFRRSKEWHTFREKKRKEQKIDPITGSPLTKRLQSSSLGFRPKTLYRHRKRRKLHWAKFNFPRGNTLFFCCCKNKKRLAFKNKESC